MELLPAKATFAPGEPIEVELRGGDGPSLVTLYRLDRKLAAIEVPAGQRVATFPPQEEGGYGVEAYGARTALDVLTDPFARARYGFVSNFDHGREVDEVADNVRRLHLNAVQFYDWMYRHARLLPPAERFTDALGRELSLDTVCRFATVLRNAGSVPMGYAAVYAAGREEWPDWQTTGLYRPGGEPWKLGENFLYIVDPTNERWQAHLASELRGAQERVGFGGFQLDQYGAPKRALRADGREVDLAAAFPQLIDRLAADLPQAKLVFNNVNDFPTWTTATTRQDAVYVEVWPPHTQLADLTKIIETAHLLAPEKSVIVAPYLSLYRDPDQAQARATQDILLATLFSHGAAAILHGESHAVLTDPYFVDHVELDAESEATTRCYYDFAVRYGDLLFDRSAVDVTSTHLGGINKEIRVDAPVTVTVAPEAGSLWARAVRLSDGLLVSLIDLSSQTDTVWDAPKNPGRPLSGVRLNLERSSVDTPHFLFADPNDTIALAELEAETDGNYHSVALPDFRIWSIVWARMESDR